MLRYAVIMAGGSGERFWPASRRARPKQLLRLTDPNLSMIEEAIERIAPLIPRERILIATSELLARPIAEALPGLPSENVLAEPEKRNTAACLALAAAHLEQRHPDEDVVMAVLTADHQIGVPDQFRATVARALDFAATNDALVTIGVVPTRPETGYGYIEVAPAEARGAASHDAGAPLPVVRFREKPNEQIARQYAKSGHHYWNSGMFFWRVSTLLRGLAKHMGDLELAERAMVAALAGRAGAASLRDVFLPLADVSVDVGLMERAGNVYVVPADFPWDDVGAWDALERTRGSDEGNVVVGDAVLVDVKDSIVFNEPGDAMAVAVIGLDGVVVATTRDGVLVCRKDRAQDVRRAVTELRKRGLDRFT
jgi:mannose-1-phosphate guanylyltransferase